MMPDNALPVTDAALAIPLVDPIISYPSYISFDEFIDVERLRSLDGYIRQRIKRYVADHEEHKFYTGPFTLDEKAAGRPGSRMIYLAESEMPDSYFDLDRTEIWHHSSHASEFTLLMDLIHTLPFESTGRILIMYDDVPRAVPAHRDHTETETLHEFIWLRTNLKKPFFMLNNATGEKLMVDSYSAWFDSVNQYHGSEPVDGLTFSIRVDGKFTESFRSQIPRPAYNAASTPSYWDAILNKG
jgi:hypothetical protein